jgi:isopenicillin N synthase-like dioxygenase
MRQEVLFNQDQDPDQVPVIDVSPLFSSDTARITAVAEQIRQASVNIGFFYVKAHNISPELLDAVQMASKYFFSLPESVKRSIQVNQAHRGYVPFAQTTQPGRKFADLKESFNFAFPFTADDPLVLEGKTLIGLNQWLEGELAWRRILERYYLEIFELGQKILEAFALTLKLPTNFFRERYKRPLVRARLLHYPPQEADHGDEQFGAAEHTDYGAITILWQDGIGGLQVKNRSGQWIDTKPIENTFVINIGDMLERWSNHLFVSTPHRVMNRSGQERYSIPVFYDPDYEAVISCLPNCASSEHPAKYPPIVAGDYITSRYDGTYAYRQHKKESQS